MQGDETKEGLMNFLINAASLGLMKAKNEAEEEKKIKTEKKENDAKNEVVDKRDIIRQIMAIAGKEEASEDVKTIAKLAEKLAYDKSEAKTADNGNDDEKEKEKAKAKNKCKNEDDDEKKEKYTQFKEKIDKTVENKKAVNSLDEMKKMFYAGNVEKPQKYMSQKEGIELGKKLY